VRLGFGRIARGEIRTRLVLRGRVWPGGSAQPIEDGLVVVGADGLIRAVGPAGDVPAGELVDEDEVLAGLQSPAGWIGPGIVDAHVHLELSAPAAALRGGVVAVRDLGCPPDRVHRWRTPAGSPGAPKVATSGPLLTAPGGYPSRGWGTEGFAAFIDEAEQTRSLVSGLAEGGVDVIKLAIEPAVGPAPDAALCREVVAAAAAAGRAVVAHALDASAVETALEAGVAELAHVPTEPLPDSLVTGIAEAGMSVVSTLHIHEGATTREDVVDNASRLLAAGVTLRYGTDSGSGGSRAGADVRELELLTDTGLDRMRAMVTATELAAGAAGFERVDGPSGRLQPGEPAALVVLDGDPREEWRHWRRPHLVLVGRQYLRR
jgi:imidazolonepropionase-like amidohydrolase